MPKETKKTVNRQNKRKTTLTRSAQKRGSRSNNVTEILSSESRLSPFWANTPTSEWNEDAYFISAGFQDLKLAQQSLLSQYNLIKNVLSGFPCPEYDLVRSRLDDWKKKSKERAKTWESVKKNVEIRNQQLKLNLLKVNEQINQVLAYQGRADEGELIIRGKNRQVDDDIIDDNNDKSTDVSANQASASSIIQIVAISEVNRTILPSTGRDVVNVFRMWAVPNNMEFILDPNDQRMVKIFTSTELEELRNMAKCYINLTTNKDLWDFVESFRIHNVCKYVHRPTINEYKNYCASKELNLDLNTDEQYHNKIYVINAIQAFIRRVDVYGRNHVSLSASEDWWSANIINPLIEFCYFDQGNVVPSIPSRDRRNRERDSIMEVRIKSGNKPDFHLTESPRLMCGEIKREDDLKTDQKNTGKLLQELSDELELVFGSLPKNQQQVIMEIEATGYKIQKKRVGIYVMRVLGNGVYLGVEIDNFEIPTILQDIDKLIDAIQKVLISKVRFEESVKRIEITKRVVYPSSPGLASNLSVSDLPGKIIRATSHSPKRV
ncbi:7686_t:CDS:10 [Paraglomus brasilianum]|uniref:7686_t:CDS:1 n=1 Tax=Paraglomus brasilianum TaxID=144538 RepID=A0A9N9CY08_9GLOM|nr:7686_t:CDS:10 [Paraglomus brasilianum]